MHLLFLFFGFCFWPVDAAELLIQSPRAVVRTSPTPDSPIVGHLPKGKRAWVTDEKNGFSKLRSRARRSLWVQSSDLVPPPDSEAYDLDLDVDAPFSEGILDFKRIRLDLGASAGRASNESFVEGAVGFEYYMMERLSWRNALLYRKYQTLNDFIGLDTSARGNGNLPLGALGLRGIIGAGYRFATATEGAPFVEVGGFAALKGFDVGIMLKFLNRSIFDSSREDVVIYSVVLSGGTGFF